MMNKRRTSEIGKAKYLLFAPLVAALLLVSNIETVAREVSKQLPGNVTMQEMSSSSSAVANAALADSAKKAKQVVGTKKKAKTAQQAKTTQQSMTAKTAQLDKKSTVVCGVVEQMPQYPGGIGEFMKYVGTNIKYPKAAAEALRVVSTSPKWTPGKRNGKPVAMKYVVPVSFQIPAPKDAEQK